MRWLVVISLSMVFVCCNQSSFVKQQFSLKDSVLKKYLARIDSLDYYDTTNQDYRVLRAYQGNDTAFFIEMKRKMESGSEYIFPPATFDSCVHLEKLTDLSVNEGYRFYHNQSFCEYGQRITITRSSDAITLFYVEYGAVDQARKVEYYDLDGNRKFGPGCAIVKEFKKTLSRADWDALENLLGSADYWGLKERNYNVCLDGSTWRIDAFVKEGKHSDNRHAHSVRRSCGGGSSFYEIGRFFLKLSGEKTSCGQFF